MKIALSTIFLCIISFTFVVIIQPDYAAEFFTTTINAVQEIRNRFGTMSLLAQSFFGQSFFAVLLIFSILMLKDLLEKFLKVMVNNLKKSSQQFQTIDKEYKIDKTSYELILNKLNELEQIQPRNTDEIISIVEKFINDSKQTTATLEYTFESYFLSITQRLESQIGLSDAKASMLLDKGTGYAKFGIIFYIFTIILWQILSLLFQFKEHFFYGMASCTVIFIFIEFISAWFLKQYKSFTDTSTYLVKLKSIFDKYMLCNLIAKEDNDRQKHLGDMLSILSDEIKWPETYLSPKGDNGFAKEAMESMTCFFEAMKYQAKTVSGLNMGHEKGNGNRLKKGPFKDFRV